MAKADIGEEPIRERRHRHVRWMLILAVAGIAGTLFVVGCADTLSEKSRAAVTSAQVVSQTDGGETIEWDIAKVDGRWFDITGNGTRGFDVVTYVKCDDGGIRADASHAESLEVMGDAEEGEGHALYHCGSSALLELHLPASAIG